MKLDIALRHNTKLLDENSTLTEITNQLRFELKNAQDDMFYLKRQMDDQLRNTSK
jgi:hypothetical protein